MNACLGEWKGYCCQLGVKKPGLDLATVLGVLSAFSLLGAAIFWQGNWGLFFNLNALLIVVGGTVGATLIHYRLGDILRVIRVVRQAFVSRDESWMEIIPRLVGHARQARKEGVLSLEGLLRGMDDPFLQAGLGMIVDGVEAERVEAILLNGIACEEERHRVGIAIFEAMGQYAPAFGMIGTLIGLIAMLRSLDQVEAIAPAMAVALVTTFYGAILSNVVFLPIAGKLREKSSAEILHKKLLLSGLVGILDGENPQVLEQRLISFLPGDFRRDYYRRQWR